MPNIQHLLDSRVTAAMRAAFPDVPAPAIVQSSQDSQFGDYQANGAMALAKLLKMKPRDVAAAVVARLEISDLAEKVEIAGPGFINIRLRSDWVAEQLGLINPDKPEDRLGVPRAEKPETVVVDYSAPNLAKEMHVGHLRSTIIGDALARMLDFAGHKVVRQNHVGDWGTQFGMLVAFLIASGRLQFVGATVVGPSMQDLEDFYRRARERFDQDPEFAQRARDRVVMLQQGDMPTFVCWAWFVAESKDHCEEIYKRLGVLLKREDIRGESAYNDVLPDIIRVLREKGLVTKSEGAQCVFLPGFVAKDGSPLPLIVQKSDEGYLYATTDLAALAFRTGHLPPSGNPQSAIRNPQSPRADRVLYVVDARQAQHFQMVFACARLAGFAPESVALEHVAFGTMMGADGKPFKTREGGTVKLMELLNKAEELAGQLVAQKNSDDVAAGRAEPLTDDQMKDIAHKVGIGAVKYADLSQNRTSDYVFSWAKMLSLDGNTAPYMQYAYARIRSIFRKGGHEAEQHRADAAPIPLDTPQELALAKTILRFAEVLDRALEDYRPNVLAAYLYDLAGAFTAFYDACPVIQSEEPLRSTRLKLCDLTARVMKRGLYLLGIEIIERM
jgi:arginyl-tRNA synthetase